MSTIRLYNKGYNNEIQLDERFLKEAEKILFSSDSSRWLKYSKSNLVDDFGEIVAELVDGKIIPSSSGEKFLDLVEDFYGSDNYIRFSKVKYYADEDNLSTDLAGVSFGLGTGTPLIVLLFLAIEHAGNIIFSSSGFADALVKVLALFALALLALLGGMLSGFGLIHAYHAVRSLLRRSKTLLIKLKDLTVKLVNKVKSTEGTEEKVEAFKELIRENSDIAHEITNEIKNKL
ncbi:MAG: hypothetical protein QXF12_03530 [Candidatus Aenigmatarchaeota archaeon]